MLLDKNLNHSGSQLFLQIAELLWGYVLCTHSLVSFAMARSVPK